MTVTDGKGPLSTMTAAKAATNASGAAESVSQCLIFEFAATKSNSAPLVWPTEMSRGSVT